MIKGSKMSIESRLKMSEKRKGRKQSKEHIENLTRAKKGKKRPKVAGKNNGMYGRKRTEEEKQKIRIGHLGKKMPPRTLEHRKHLSNALKGDKSSFWKGGITPINKLIRSSSEYRLWRTAVFERDNYTCVWCGSRFIKGVTGDVVLNADHIKPFATYPELRFAIDNGRTLCLACHKTTDSYARRLHR